MSTAQLRARARNYVSASVRGFELGNGAAHGLPELPDYPRSGNQQCNMNCRCNWEIVERRAEWRCYWRLQPAEHCPDCVENAERWNPLIIPKDEARTQAQLHRRLNQIAGQHQVELGGDDDAG
jgi:hypothetical protein